VKKIYFVINDVTMPGGTSRVTLNLYNELKQRYSDKYTISIISSSVTRRSKLLVDNIIDLGLESPHKLSKFKKIFWYVEFIWKINKFLKKESPDIVIGIGVLFNLCLSLYLKKSYKIFGAEHSYYGNNHKGIIFLRKLLYHRLDKIISLTKVDESEYKQFHNNVVTIPNFTNFYDNKKYSTLNYKNLLFIGRFTTVKGVDILLDLMIDFFKKNSDWKLLMYGEGPIKQKIIDKIIFEKLEKNIIINEPIDNIEIAFLKSSIYVMTSRSEGFPMVLLEAKVFGLPIVSFDCPTGPSEIIHNNEDGFLIPRNDNQIFLEKLSLLANNFELREEMGKKAIENVKEFYPDKIMQQWEKILDE